MSLDFCSSVKKRGMFQMEFDSAMIFCTGDNNSKQLAAINV